MPVKKVIAYFMHEKEEGICNTLISNKQHTPSYIIGDVDDAQLKQLQEQHIVVQVLEPLEKSADDITVHKLNRISAFRNIHLPGMDTIVHEQATTGFPAFYSFAIEGPLLEDYRTQLSAKHIDILEFIPPDKYMVRLESENALYDLQGMLFTKNISFYSSRDTGINVVNLIPPPQVPDQQKAMKSFDILLHRPEDLDTMVQWLLQKGISIAGSGGRKIRIYLLDDSPVQQEIPVQVAVQSFDEYVPPKLHNNMARQITGVDALAAAAGAGIEYNGDGQTVGVADTGIDDTHADFQHQLYPAPSAWGRPGDYSDQVGHGTHVAGSIVGNGNASNGSIRGTAPGAKLFFQSILNASNELQLPLQLQTLFDEAYNKGVRVHNNSWGSSTSSRYTVSSVEVDDFVWQHKDMLLVFSAGNDGNAMNPVNVPKGYPDFLSIGSPASAKNVLTVGASRSTRNAGGYAPYTYGTIWPNAFPNPPMSLETISGNSDALACFSSRGPCDDYRIKPDVVAPGTDIVSVKSANAPLGEFWGIYPTNPQYAIMGGTSMAAPIVAGCAAITREYYQKKHQHPASAALVKATIINGCRKMTAADCVVIFPDLPNYNQGYGLVDMTSTIPSPAKDFFLGWYDNYLTPNVAFKMSGQHIRMELNLPINTWLRICMAYTDVPGRALQNNLNLLLDYNPTNQKWTGNEKVPALLKMPDPVNNVEAIVIDNAPAGKYRIQVTATNIVKGIQDFALVVTTGDPQTTFIKP